MLTMTRSQGDGQAAFLRKLAAEIMEQNSNQHQLTQTEAKTAAREQVGFNLAGYLDDFSKALSVRTPYYFRSTQLKSMGLGRSKGFVERGWRFARVEEGFVYVRASGTSWRELTCLCRELADLLLMKGRQSAG